MPAYQVKVATSPVLVTLDRRKSSHCLMHALCYFWSVLRDVEYTFANKPLRGYSSLFDDFAFVHCVNAVHVAGPKCHRSVINDC